MKKILPIIFAFFPILNIYETGVIPGLSIGQILLVVSLIIAIIKNHLKFRVQFNSFLLYSIVVTIVCSFKGYNDLIQSAYELFSLLLFFVLLSFVIKQVNYNTFIKYLFYLGIISLAFFFVQYLLSKVGIHIAGIIPILPLSNGSNTADFYASHLVRNRLSSIFQEPAHYAEFMSLFLACVLFLVENKKKKLYLSVAISISIVLCQSAGGYALLLACWACWLYYSILPKKSIYKVLLLLIILGLFLLIVPFLLNSEIISGVVNRYLTLSLSPDNSEYGYSSYTRLFRGYILFFEGNLFDKIFGQGIGNILSYVRHNPNSQFLSVTDYDANWVNSFQYLLFSVGIVGTLIFFRSIIGVYKKTSSLGKTLTILYLMAFLSSGILLTASSMIFLYVICKETCDSQFVVKGY